MGIRWKGKYFSIVFGSGWEKGDFSFFNIRKTPLGWDMNIWRFAFSYDNYKKFK